MQGGVLSCVVHRLPVIERGGKRFKLEQELNHKWSIQLNAKWHLYWRGTIVGLYVCRLPNNTNML